jgi:uncharacterized lipoprotein YddW (UPF0748 family)
MMRFSGVRWWFVAAAFFLAFRLAAQQPPEFRALWADTFHAGMRNSGEVTALVNQARTNNFNAIIVEVRKRADAYYNSLYEPKATDVDPQTFDPLADLLNKAHNGGRRIEVHAWITTYLAAQSTPPPQPNHPFNLHPEWLSQDVNGSVFDGSNYQFDQGLPEVQKHVYNVAMDIITRYDVDGFHFDYVRYTRREWGYHSNTVARFNQHFGRAGNPSPTDPAWLQFRRDQVSGLVRKIYLNAIAVKPQVKISAATICFAPGITTDAQWFSSSSAWGNVLQDWRGWMQEGILDLNVPMMYFDHRRYSNDWSAWSIFAKEHAYSRHIALGHGSYLNTLSNTIHQLRSTRVPTVNSNRAADGFAMYSYAVPSTNNPGAPANLPRATMFHALNNPSIYDPIPTPLFTGTSAPPAMTWKTMPALGHLKGTIREAGTSNELDGALVSIMGPATAARTNDATGFYGFANLPPGSYTVTASYSNLASQSALVLITTGAVATVDFALGVSNAPLHNVQVYPGEREAIISWATAAPGSSRVNVGGAPSSSHWDDGAPGTNHVVLVTGLLPNTSYQFSVLTETDTNTLASPTASFSTAGEIIIDNGAASLTGAWTPGTSAPDKFGSDYVFASVNANVASATFTPQIATPGAYDVFVWYSQGGNRSTNAPFLVTHEGGNVPGGINQTAGGGGWRAAALGRNFDRGNSGYFQWQNQTPETSRVVIADAVKFVYATNQPATPGGIPKWWSRFFFNGTASPVADPDFDGFTNLEEYVAGTDPKRASSRLKLALHDRTSNQLRFRFGPFHIGRNYVLESQSVLGTNGWMAAGLSPQRLANGEGLVAVPIAPGDQKFYRLRVQLAD